MRDFLHVTAFLKNAPLNGFEAVFWNQIFGHWSHPSILWWTM